MATSTLVQELRSQVPHSPKKRAPKEVPKGYRVTAESIRKAKEQNRYIKVGYDNMTPKKLSGLFNTWDAKDEYTRIDPYPKPTQPGVRRPAVGKGYDVIALPGIRVERNGAVVDMELRVIGKWIHIRNYLTGQLGLSADEAVVNLAERAYGVHTLLDALPPQMRSKASTFNGYIYMLNDLDIPIPNNPGMTVYNLSKAVHDQLLNAYRLEIGVLERERAAGKVKIDVDVEALIKLSGKIKQADFLDKMGQPIPKVHRAVHARQSIAEKLREFILEGDKVGKLFSISKYAEGRPPTITKRPKEGSNRSKKVPVVFTFEGRELRDIVYTSDAKSVVPALVELGIAKDVANAIKSRVEADITARVTAVKTKPHHFFTIEAAAGAGAGGVVPTPGIPEAVAPEMLLQLAPAQQEAALTVPSLGEGVPSLGAGAVGTTVLPTL